MALTAATAYRATDPYEQLISQMIAIERQPQLQLKSTRAEQVRLKGVIGDLDSKISALNKVVTSFTDLFASPFEARSATGGTAGHFSVSASDTAAYGAHTIQVERLASSDNRISAQFNNTGTTLADFFAAKKNAAQTISIGVATPTDADPDARTNIDVTIDPATFTDTSDAGILKTISSAINDAMDAAVEAGTITSTQRAAASTVSETSDTARLSLRSGGTGYSNRLTLTDSAGGRAGGLLDALDILDSANPDKLATGTAGGQTRRVGTGEADSDLTSRFQLDGLTLYRNTNSVTDALEGVTLSLQGIGTGEETFAVEPGSDSIQKEVEDFIKKYNDVLGYIEGKSRIDGDSGFRGDFANDSTLRGLRFGLRNDAVRSVTSQEAGAPQNLTDLGIEIGDDGTLSLKDPDTLIAAVKKDAGAVQSLFSGTDGVATRMETRLEQFVGAKGLLSARKKSYDDRLARLDERIEDWDDRLLQREDQLRAQFAKMQEAIALFQGQQQYLSSFLFSGGGFY